MSKILLVAQTLMFIILSGTANAQINLNRALKAGLKTVQAVTLTDAQIEGYVKEFIVESDKKNKICDGDNPYAVRLEKILGSINDNDGLNIKVYEVADVNAFACADGSIRVFSGLMDIMSDDEILGVVGHEIGHIKNKDTKDAFRNALINSALRDGIAATSSTAAKLTDSQLGDLGEALAKSSYSKQQEFDADNYGYEFLKKNDKNPWAMALSFEKLKEMEEKMSDGKSNKIQQLFSTHPNIVERTKKMAERATNDGFKRPE